MAINEIVEVNGKKSFSVYVNIRSKAMPHIRLQKRVRGITSKAEATRQEKKIIRDLSLKVAQKEGHGLTWRMIIFKWAGTVTEESYLDSKYDPATIKDYVSLMHKWTHEC